jgi:hypothetical protein
MLLRKMSKSNLDFGGEQNLLSSNRRIALPFEYLKWAKISLILRESQMALPQ